MKIALAAILILSAASVMAQPQLRDRKTGQYLGDYSANQYAPNSISNPYGQHGSKYMPDSVNNPYGRYGSRYSPDSANNPYAVNPPAIYNPYGR